MLALICFALIAYLLTVNHFVPKVAIMAHWTTPPILGVIFSTNLIMDGVTALICLAVSVVIYLLLSIYCW